MYSKGELKGKSVYGDPKACLFDLTLEILLSKFQEQHQARRQNKNCYDNHIKKAAGSLRVIHLVSFFRLIQLEVLQ